MALTAAELARIKFELGHGLLTNNAAAYARTTAMFEQAIAPYLVGGANTTSSTTVAESDTPAPVTLTLASATGFTAGDRVVVDVDSRQESATIQSVSGSTITLLLSLAHSGSYRVAVEGPESIVREILARCVEIGARVESSMTTAGIQRAEDIWFFPNGSVFSDLRDTQMHHRDELASALGIANLWRERRAAGGMVSLY